jgi:uncharacterized membrane protein
MVSQPQKDTPFGLEQNVAAGLAYLLGVIGGIVMLAGGGTNRFVKWAAAQSITIFSTFFLVRVVLSFLGAILHLWVITLPLGMLVGLLWLVVWLWTSITAFQGKEVEVPVIGGITKSIFGATLA